MISYDLRDPFTIILFSYFIAACELKELQGLLT